MGECIILNRGAGKNYKLPVLNDSYPSDVTIIESANGSAQFQVIIATDGNPAEYTYQWYVNGSEVSGATGSSYTKSGLTSAAVYTVYCVVTNKAGSVTSRVATLTVSSSQPSYTYSGQHTLTKQNTYDWLLTLKSSGTLRFSNLGNVGYIDVFMLGGGAGGGSYNRSYYGGGGGGGGKTTTVGWAPVAINTDYVITIGGGGSASGNGGTTSTPWDSAAGGTTGADWGYGGSGGSGGGCGGYSSGRAGGNGGSDGNNGTTNSSGGNDMGYGQGSTTRAFGETSGALYAGGGGGGGGRSSSGSLSNPGSGGSGGGAAGNGGNCSSNTGGGGGGAKCNTGTGGSGGSGIVLIRNAR